MSLIKSNSKIISRNIKDKSGKEFLVFFLVVETESGIDLKLISAKEIRAQNILANGFPATRSALYALLLPGCVVCSEVYYCIKNSTRKISYIYRNLSYLISQPARAPSF